MWSSKYGGAAGLEKRGAACCSHLAAAARLVWKHVEWRDSGIKLSQSGRAGRNVEHVTRSSVHRGAADLQISGAARCGNRAIAAQAVW